MIRPPFHSRSAQGESTFRWRGNDVSRLEGLSDGVFAFSLTLIVVSIGVPRTLDEVAEGFRNLPVFALTFAVLFWIWYQHFLFHRRYGLEDAWTATLNGALLLVVLIYVYPLRFLFGLLYGSMALGRKPLVRDAEGAAILGPDGQPIQVLHPGQDSSLLMVLYGLGFASIFGIYTALTWHAWRKRDLLELDAQERAITRASLGAHLGTASIGLASAGLALGGGVWNFWAGLAYTFIGPFQGIWWAVQGRRINRLAPGENADEASGPTTSA